MVRTLVLSLVLGLSTLAQANSDSDKYYTISHSRTEEITYSSNEELNAILADSANQYSDLQKDMFWQAKIANSAPTQFAAAENDAFGDLLGAVGNVPAIAADPELAALIKVGQAAWKVIVANKPVINDQWAKMSVVPKGLEDWTQMAGWSAPESKVYKVVYTNGFGVDVVSLTYRVIYSWGGSYKGQGKYLANVSIQPVQVIATWGFQIDATASTGTPLNIGTETNPIASAELSLNYSVKTLIKAQESQEVFHVSGDGRFQKIN